MQDKIFQSKSYHFQYLKNILIVKLIIKLIFWVDTK